MVVNPLIKTACYFLGEKWHWVGAPRFPYHQRSPWIHVLPGMLEYAATAGGGHLGIWGLMSKMVGRLTGWQFFVRSAPAGPKWAPHSFIHSFIHSFSPHGVHSRNPCAPHPRRVTRPAWGSFYSWNSWIWRRRSCGPVGISKRCPDRAATNHSWNLLLRKGVK